MSLQGQHTEQVQAADSVADFNLAFVKDQSITGTGEATLLIATTECTKEACSGLLSIAVTSPEFSGRVRIAAQKNLSSSYSSPPLCNRWKAREMRKIRNKHRSSSVLSSLI